MIICLERDANDVHMIQLLPLQPIISCFVKIHIGLTFLVPANPGCPKTRPLNEYHHSEGERIAKVGQQLAMLLQVYSGNFAYFDTLWLMARFFVSFSTVLVI